MTHPASSWLSRHPHLLVHWLAIQNGLRRFLRDRRRAASAVGGAAIACFALLYATVTSAGSVELIEPMLSYWPLATLLAAAPVAFSRVRFAERLLSGVPLLLHWIAISILIAILAAVEAASPRSALTLIAAISAGAVAGLLVGLWTPRSRPQHLFEASRYVRAARVTDIGALRPSDRALARWPINLTLSWARPENSRVVLVIALGTPPMMALYLGVLWLSVVLLVCAISLASCYRAGSATLKLAFSLSALAAIEVREHAWSIPFAVLLAAWHLRVGMKS